MKGGDDQANNKNDKKAESHKRTETINKLQAKRRQAFTQRANVRQAATASPKSLRIPTMNELFDKRVEEILTAPDIVNDVDKKIELMQGQEIQEIVMKNKKMQEWKMAINKIEATDSLSSIALMCGEEDMNLPFLTAVDNMLQARGLKLHLEKDTIPSLHKEIEAAKENLRNADQHMRMSK
ncbi:MAG: hypothetical protein BGO43_09070 [Gammaproteobacteria bacterium 39-13]|nr:hypothetical protein [Gammaproteobacteria bacterium]OJV92225.1 MAG: hypothetical protein BGO43_09070 [Gammaproteobacteria bacterium 39-13]